MLKKFTLFANKKIRKPIDNMCFITHNLNKVKSKEFVKLFEVEYYEKSDGTYPAEEFIFSQDIKMQTEFLKFVQFRGII